jgi:carboxymethylenebutenolidase
MICHGADFRMTGRQCVDGRAGLAPVKEKPMSFYHGMTCENVTISGDKGTPITAYIAKPSGPGTFPGVVLNHHLPGWSEFYIETTRRFAHHGYLAICANLYQRSGDGNPDDIAAKVRAEGQTPKWLAIPRPR